MPEVEGVTDTLDVTGVNCPVPVLKTRQAFDGIEEGGVLKVIATDPGSEDDIESWASSIDGAELLEQTAEERSGETVFKHYVKKNGG